MRKKGARGESILTDPTKLKGKSIKGVTGLDCVTTQSAARK